MNCSHNGCFSPLTSQLKFHQNWQIILKPAAVDEDIRTFWSAQSGNKGEWISIDLKKQCQINAVQINFAENNTKLYGRDPKIFSSIFWSILMIIKTWKMLADKRLNKTVFRMITFSLQLLWKDVMSDLQIIMFPMGHSVLLTYVFW